ncbi:MAG: transporter [Pedosphaera sp. Tous-C6FEB]|nr:MAG: transporter [Pedosphaera sp. Tous-C6FEB]
MKEIPNPKLQAPKTLQIPSSKAGVEWQRRSQPLRLWSLVLGAWCFFGAWNLELGASEKLTLKEARDLALRQHPRITAAEFKALAARQAVLQTRAALLPAFSLNAVAVGAADANTRLTAGGGLNNPTVIERAAGGLSISQLITDFGRTDNLLGGAKDKARAEGASTDTARAQLLLAVSATYFSAQQAQSVLRVVDQTVTNRQTLLDQVSALAKNQLKSDLDVSFARVSLEEARLLQLRARNDLDASFTALDTLLGGREPRRYTLVEEALPAALPGDAAPLVADALRLRPELERLRAERDAALKQARADKALHYPTLSALAGVGYTPVHDTRLEDTYASAGLVLSLPLFTGGRDTARQKEAELKAKAAEESLKEEENNVIRDVRLALLRAQHAHERLALTAKLLTHARTANDLAVARYKLGASSITELNQAQLNLTTAEIAEATARYEYLVFRAALDFQRGLR